MVSLDDELTIISRFSTVMISHYTVALIKIPPDMASVGYGLAIMKTFLPSLQAFLQEFAFRGLQIYVHLPSFLPTIFDHIAPLPRGRTRKDIRADRWLSIFKWVCEGKDAFWLLAIETMTLALHTLALEPGCMAKDRACSRGS